MHAYALSDLVSEFIDDEPVNPDNGSNNGPNNGTNNGTNNGSNNETNSGNNDATTGDSTQTITEATKNFFAEKFGCESTVAGAGIALVMLLAVVGLACVKKPEEDCI